MNGARKKLAAAMRIVLWAALVVPTVMFCCRSALPAPMQAQTPTAILVLDSSRSMWGHIGSVNKVVIVREALSKTFKKFEGKLRLGLMAYGYQKESGCDDFGTLKPLGPLDAEAYGKAVQSIAPKGSTPMAATLRAAAEELIKLSGPGHIVLLTDGLDNCRGDPCGLAEELAKASSGLKIHAIAFDRDNKQALEGLQCVAAPSEGIFAFATSKEELEAALDRVFANIMSPSVSPLAKKPALPQGVAPNTPGVVKMRAYLASASQEITGGVIWRVYSGRAGRDGRYKLLKEDSSPRPEFRLKPGSYHIHASYGLAHTTKRIDVLPGVEMHEQVIINAGALRLQAVRPEGMVLPQRAVRFDIYSEDTDQFGNRRKLISNAPAGPMIRLNSGTYQVVSTYGDSNAVVKADIEIKAGKLTEAVIVHKAAKVTFKLVRRPGGEALADTRWRIMTRDGRIIEESAGAFPSYILAEGAYKVTAEQGGRTYGREFTVNSSGSQEVEVLMQ